jgi:hypothetical protein
MVRAVALLLLVGSGCGKVGEVRNADAAVDAIDAIDAAPDAPMIDGLVAWYRMDVPIPTTGTTGTIVDATGHHDGACDFERCPAFTAFGRLDGAYEFNGIGELFHVPSAAEFEGTQGFTITAWIKRADAPGGCVINKGYQMGDNAWQACISAAAEGQLAFISTDANAADGGDTQAIIAPLLDTSHWYHLALWWDGSISRKATYVDGERVAFTDNVSIVFDSADINIGSDIDFDVGGPKLVGPFRGKIDDVRIYNRALSGTDIDALAHPHP